MTVETYGFKFSVDARDAAKGYGDFQKSVDGVFASLSKFEAHAKKVMDGVTASSRRGQSDIAKYTNQFKGLANIKIDGRAGPAITKLTEAMRGFKAPNTAQINNMRSFFRALGTMPDLGAAARTVRTVGSLSAAMSGFKAPSSAQSQRLVQFAKALGQATPVLSSIRSAAGLTRLSGELTTLSASLATLRVPSKTSITNLSSLATALSRFRLSNLSGAGHLVTALTAIAGFRAPSAVQVRNLQQFITAVSNLRVPTNGTQIATFLSHVASAASNAAGSLRNFRGNLNSIGWSGFNRGAHTARLEMMGLQNAFSGTFQIGSAIRSLLGSLTIGELGREFFKATNTALQFKAAMGVVDQSTAGVSYQLGYVNKMANRFGQDMLTAETGFAKFAISANKAGANMAQTKTIYEGFSTAMTVLGTSADRQTDVWLALQQVMSKGYLASEELNQQINEHLPGALGYLSQEAKRLGFNMQDALKKKSLDAVQTLLYLAKRYKEDFGPALADSLQRPSAQLQVLKNNFMSLYQAIGDNGATSAVSNFLSSLNKSLDPASVDRFAHAVGKGLEGAVNRVSAALNILYNNWNAIKGPLGTSLSLLGKWMLISGGLQIGKALIVPLIAARAALVSFSGTMARMGAAGSGAFFTRLTASTVPLAGAFGTLTVRAVAANASMNLLRIGMTGVRMAGGALMGLIGGAWGATLLLVTAMIGGMASAMFNLAQNHEAVMNSMKDGFAVMRENVGLLNQQEIAALDAAQGLSGVQAFATSSQQPIRNFAGEVGNAAQSLWDMAAAARAANIQRIKGVISDLQTQQHTAYLGTTEGRWNDLWGRSHHSASDLWHSIMNKAGGTLQDSWTNGDSSRQADSDLRSTTNRLRDMNTLLQRVESEKPEDTVKRLKLKSEGEGGYGGDPRGTGHGTGTKKKKHPKVDHAFNDFKEMETSIDDMISRFAEDNPLAKLQMEFVRDITKEGQTLLGNKAYHTFAKQLEADFDTGKVSVEGLINAIQSGGIKPKVLEDLKKRYHMDTTDIIRMLRNQQVAYEQSVKEATVKAIEAQMKASNTVLRRLAEGNPTLKVIQDFVDDLGKEGAELLTAGSFEKWYKSITSGALDAEAATNSLIDAINNGGVAQQILTDIENRAGVTKDVLIESIQRQGRAMAFNLKMAKEEEVFMARHNRELGENIALARMSDREQRVASALIEEIRGKQAKGIKITQDQVNNQLTLNLAMERQLDIFQQQREFFENNGIHKYIKDLRSAGEAVHDLDYTFLHSLEDTIYNFMDKGKLSFKSLFTSVKEEFMRFTAQNVTKSILNFLVPNSENQGDPSIFGGLFRKLGFDTSFKPKAELGSKVNPMWVRLDSNGDITLGGGLYGAATSSQSDVWDSVDQEIWNLFGTSGTVPRMVTDCFGTGTQQAAPQITNVFTKVFKGLGGVFQSIFQTILRALGVGGAGGGGGSDILATLINVGMAAFGGGGGFNPATISGLSGDVSSMIAANPGIFKEGGEVGQAVAYGSMPISAFMGAPHYREGTPNTSGGHPAILHDNEAVIPLSRGRKVPVDLSGGKGGALGGNSITVNVYARDAVLTSTVKDWVAEGIDTAAKQGAAQGANMAIKEITRRRL